MVHFSGNFTCKWECNENEYAELTNKVCYENCPYQYPYIWNSLCVNICPTQFLDETLTCVIPTKDCFIFLNWLIIKIC